MSEVDRTACLANDPLQNPVAQRLRDEYEAALKQARASGPRPQRESYLERAPTAERAALERALEHLEQVYQQRRSSAGANAGEATIDVTYVGGVNHETRGGAADTVRNGTDAPIDAGATIDVAPATPHDATIDLAPGADPNATLDPAVVADPSATIDPADPDDASIADVAITPAPRGRTTFTPRDGSVCADTLDQPPIAGPMATIDLGGAARQTNAQSTDFSLGGLGGAADTDDSELIAGHKILGELGRGGMGVVYKARQVKLNRVVALKMVLAGAHAGSEQLARFQTEAEAVARLQHPNVVQIYEVGEHEGLPFFSLEYVDGGSLAGRIGGKPQPPADAARMVERLADAMDSAHRQQIIHRDLKPANVLLTADGDPKITDFGLAKRLEGDSGQTRSGTLMGTPSYMAPEQARGDTKNVGPLSDIYALGAILYEMLTGRPPFQGTTIVEVLDLVQKQEPVPPSRLQPNVPRDLETICLKCLQKEPPQRYATAGALAADLLRFLGGETIMARPVGHVEKGWRWCRRNPRLAGLTAAVVFLCVIAGTAVTALWIHSARAEQAAQERTAREQKAIEETRKAAGERLEQARAAIAVGNHQRAGTFLGSSDPLLESAEPLQDVRDQLAALRAQVDVYAEFKKLLDNARFASRFGSRGLKEQAQKYCHELVDMDEQIKERTGRGAAGLPPLDAEQQQLFQEDRFEAYLIAALLETDLSASAEAATRQAAVRRAIDWLNRADQVLPGMRVTYVNRAPCWGAIGNRVEDDADIKRAQRIVPASAVDRFWHGFADHLRGRGAAQRRPEDCPGLLP